MKNYSLLGFATSRLNYTFTNFYNAIMSDKKQLSVIPDEAVINKIYFIRNEKVMLDSDLAELYGVETKRVNEQVKRNIDRFPEDFMFQLTEIEFENLKSQIATSNWGGRRTLPYAFTEHGVLMLSSVLNSDVAIKVNIHIMRVYTKIPICFQLIKICYLSLSSLRRNWPTITIKLCSSLNISNSLKKLSNRS